MTRSHPGSGEDLHLYAMEAKTMTTTALNDDLVRRLRKSADTLEYGSRLPLATECREAAVALEVLAAENAGLRSALTIRVLQEAHVERQEEWCPDQKPDLSFRGNEMAGEVGEACNIIKKLERERHGWRGSRASLADLGDELADVVHTAVLCAITAGIDLEPYVSMKFNATSQKNGLSTFIPAIAGAR